VAKAAPLFISLFIEALRKWDEKARGERVMRKRGQNYFFQKTLCNNPKVTIF